MGSITSQANSISAAAWLLAARGNAGEEAPFGTHAVLHAKENLKVNYRHEADESESAPFPEICDLFAVNLCRYICLAFLTHDPWLLFFHTSLLPSYPPIYR